MAAAQPDLSILIVGFNSVSFLEQCMGSIAEAARRHSVEILFVNNGTDASEAFVRDRFPDVRVLETRGNIGFAAGNNYLADNATGRWLLLLNPDTRLYPGALDTLLDAASRHPEFQVLGGVTMGADGEVDHATAAIVLPSIGTAVNNLLGRAPPPVDTGTDDGVAEVDALSGGFMMVRRDWWERLGGMDEEFFLYAEELDLFKRLKDQGGRAALVAGSHVFHDLGSGDFFSPTRIRFRVTGNAHYFHKHFSSPYAHACVALMWMNLLRRYWGGRVLSSRNEKYARMARGFSRVAGAPWTWMWGYNSTGADPRKGS